jgi:hypothetical protein
LFQTNLEEIHGTDRIGEYVIVIDVNTDVHVSQIRLLISDAIVILVPHLIVDVKEPIRGFPEIADVPQRLHKRAFAELVDFIKRPSTHPINLTDIRESPKWEVSITVVNVAHIMGHWSFSYKNFLLCSY